MVAEFKVSFATTGNPGCGPIALYGNTLAVLVGGVVSVFDTERATESGIDNLILDAVRWRAPGGAARKFTRMLLCGHLVMLVSESTRLSSYTPASVAATTPTITPTPTSSTTPTPTHTPSTTTTTVIAAADAGQGPKAICCSVYDLNTQAKVSKFWLSEDQAPVQKWTTATLTPEVLAWPSRDRRLMWVEWKTGEVGSSDALTPMDAIDVADGVRLMACGNHMAFVKDSFFGTVVCEALP